MNGEAVLWGKVPLSVRKAGNRLGSTTYILEKSFENDPKSENQFKWWADDTAVWESLTKTMAPALVKALEEAYYWRYAWAMRHRLGNDDEMVEYTIKQEAIAWWRVEDILKGQ